MIPGSVFLTAYLIFEPREENSSLGSKVKFAAIELRINRVHVGVQICGFLDGCVPQEQEKLWKSLIALFGPAILASSYVHRHCKSIKW